ncbi:MAG: type pilus assembly protein PilB [Bacillota bacterium]|nr:type pilus assembly protein PilB [Bacillota bacterium]
MAETTVFSQPPRLGDLLVDQGLLTRDQLAQALKRQQETGERLGQALVSLGYVTPRQIAEVLEFQLGIPHVTLADFPPEEEALRSIPGTLARRHQVLPLRISGSALLLAMADPLNVVAVDEVRLASGYEVRPAVATEEEIAQEIRNHYGALENVAQESRRLSQSRTREEPVPGSPSGTDSAAAINIVDSLFAQAVEARASDIHIEPLDEDLRVRFRIDGVLQPVINLNSGVLGPLISRIKVMAGMDIAERRAPQDGRIELKQGGHEIDVRVSTLPTIRGEKVVLRLLDKTTRIMSLSALGFAAQALTGFRQLIARPYGMVLVTGPTGCGKTTTLYAALRTLNTPQQNIITIEDPVEYQIPGINQVQVNPKAGIDFATGLRAILRQDPNIIMVGEIRDSETADVAIRSALTGHLVLSTLHTNDAAGTITRLLDMGVEPYLVASALAGVVAQRLVRCVCPRCEEEYLPEPEEWTLLELGPDRPPEPLKRGRGCPACRYTGYWGRTAIQESMVVTPALRRLILAKASAEEIRAAALQEGMIPLLQDGVAKVLAGRTTIAEVIRAAL